MKIFLLITLIMMAPLVAFGQQTAHAPMAPTTVASKAREITYADLGTPTKNQVRYVSDGDVNVTTGICTSGGLGAYAWSVQTGVSTFVWRCSLFLPGSGGGGMGDVNSDTTVAAVGQATVFSDIGGKQIGRFTSSGWVKATGGILSTQTSINLATDTNGNLPVNRLNSGTNAGPTTFWNGAGQWVEPPGFGTVVSVNAAAPTGFTFTGGPITGSGTLQLNYATGQPANRFLATPNGSIGAFSLRAIVPADFIFGSILANRCLRTDASGNVVVAVGDCGTGGTVLSFTAGHLSPLFTSSVATSTTTPALTFSLATQSANAVFAGPAAGSAVAPTFRALVVADLPLITESKFSFSDVTTGNANASQHGFLPKLSGSGSDCLRGDGSFSTCPGAGTGGDFSTNTTVSVANQVIVASGTGGKTGTFATETGIAKLTAGVLSAVAAPNSAIAGISDSQALSNKTIDGDTNTVQDLALTSLKTALADANKVIQRDASGIPVSSSSLPAVSGAALTGLNGSNIAAGTVADARLSANVSLLGQTIDLGSAEAVGTLADARFPATLPVASGVNLNALNASNLASGTVPTARLGSGTANSTTCLLGNNTWAVCPSSSGTPGGSAGQFQFNNTTFGGASNFLYTSATGQVTANQFANGNNLFYGKRASDSSPTGNFLHFQNQAASTDLFKVDVNGNTTVAGSLTMNTTGGTDGILVVSSASSGGGLQLTSGTKPTCDVTKRGLHWYVAGGIGVADTDEVCRKSSSDVYAWVTLF